ncbi:LiaF-related protein [bacterium]|nr:LiaF-related protein [bacterium]
MNDMSEVERERQGALDTITSAFATGKISIEEYEARADKIQKATALADIDAQTLGLPQPELPRDSSGRGQPAASRDSRPSFRRAAREPAYRAEDLYVEERHGSPEFSLCIMGDRRLQGDWLNADQATSVTLMGSTTLDLRDTALPPGRLKIDALAVMGEIKIIVPRGLPVKMSAFPFMGEANIQASVERRVDRRNPWVEVSGVALMGSIVVKAG